jgi:exonuclease SbcC
MLQRIFGLQSLGERTRDQLRTRLEAARDEAARLATELAALGDAGVDAIERARDAAAAADSQSDAAQSAHLAATRARQAADRAAERWRAADEAKAALAAHLASEAEIADLVARAGEARRVRGLPERVSAREEEAAKAREATRNAEIEAGTAQQARDRLAAAEAAAEQARRLAGGAPALEAEARAAERASALWAAAESAAKVHLERRAAATAARERANGAEAATVRAEAAILASEQQHAAAQRSAQEIQVDPAHRARVERTRRAESDLRAAEDVRNDAIQARDEAQARVESARTAAATAARVREEAEAELDRRRAVAPADAAPLVAAAEQFERAQAEWAIAAEKWAGASAQQARATAERARAEASVRALEELVARQTTEAGAARASWESCRAAADDARARLDRAARVHQAVALAEGLADGEPCPVCGSPEHPSLAVDPGGGWDLARGLVAAAEARAAEAAAATEQCEQALAGARGRLESAEHQLSLATDRLDQVNATLAAWVPPALPKGVDPGLPTDVLAGLARCARVAREEAKRATAASQASREAFATLERDLARLATDEATARSRASSAEGELSRAAEGFEARTRAFGVAWEALGAACAAPRPGAAAWTLFDLPRIYAELAAVDAAAPQRFAAVHAAESRLAQCRADAEESRIALERLRADAERAEQAAQLASEAEETARSAAREALDGASSPPEESVPVELRARAMQAILQLKAAEQAVPPLREAARVAGESAAAAAASSSALAERARRAEEELAAALAAIGIGWPPPPVEPLLAHALPEPEIAALERRITAWHERATWLRDAAGAHRDLPDRPAAAQVLALSDAEAASRDRADQARSAALTSRGELDRLTARAGRHTELSRSAAALDLDLSRLETLDLVLRGDRFVEFVANDYLADLALEATAYLLRLTGGRYELALGEDGAFLVRDHDSEAALRPLTSLSGGETFLSALSLALALSTQIQRGAERPLEFFFLDEGFGTLDPEALDRVLTAIEGLASGGVDGTGRLIGLVSHVPAVRERVPRYLWVTPASRGGDGSRLEMRDS